MATYFDLNLVPWRAAFNQAGAPYYYPSDQYVAWAEELGVSATETLVAINGDDLATALTLGYTAFPNASNNAFIASEGAIGLYQVAPGNTANVSYLIGGQGISRMYGFTSRPNLLLSFHPQNNLKLQNGKVQSRYGVTIINGELAYYAGSTIYLYFALRIEPGRIELAVRSNSYAVPLILVEFDPATSAVVKSTTLLSHPTYTSASYTYDLTNTVGWLASPPAVNTASLVGTVPMAGALLTSPFAGTQALGAVAVTGVARVTQPPVIPALLATVVVPARAGLTVPWADAIFGRADHASRWLLCTASAHTVHGAAWGNGTYVLKPHVVSWRVRLEADLSASWVLPLNPRSHEARWGEPAVVRASHRVNYGNKPVVAGTLDSRWSDLSVSDRALLHPWGDLTPVVAEHAVSWEVAGFRGARLESPWSDRPAATTENVLFWGDGIPPRAALSAPWGNRPQAGRTFLTAWGNGEFPRASLTAPWGQLWVHQVEHLATWTTPVPVRAERATPWGDSAWVRVDLEAGWADLAPLLPVPHQARWSNRPGALRALVTSWSDGVLLGTRHAAVWASRPVVRDDLVSPWAEHPACRQGSEARWADTVQVGADHVTGWADSDTSLALSHSLTWGDQAQAHGFCEISWAACQPVSRDLVLLWSDPIVVTVDLISSWEDQAVLLPVAHQAAWADRQGAVRAMMTPWADGISLHLDHSASWSDRALVRAIWTGSWADVTSTQPSHAVAWSDYQALSLTGHHLAWGDRSGARGLLTSAWAESQSVAAQHVLAWSESDLRLALSHGLSWGDQAIAHGHHEISWGPAQAVGANLGAPWSDRASAGRTVGTAWGDCQPVATGGHVSIWADQGAGRGSHLAAWTEAMPALRDHASPWADATSASQALESSWADAVPSRRDLGATWSNATPSRLTHAAVYADREAAEAGLTAPWGQMTPASRTQVAPWALTAPGRRACTLVWSLNERPSAAASHRANWAVLEDVNLISIDNVPEVTWEGRSVQILAARLSADEESPVWIAEEIVIAERELWSAIQLGDLIQFSIHEETWLLRVDGKGMSRPQPGDMLLSISAVSPLAWLDAPYASAITLDNANEAVSARATVAALVAPVGTLTWDLDDWLIPPGALAMTETTPLQAAREIVAAIGGLLESAPDGTPVARRRHPVSVPAYATATPDQVIQDGDLFAFRVAAAPFAGFNRVVITNEDLNGEDARDRLEYFDEDANPYDGEMRAWPNPWRPAVLGHTGHPDTEITPLGERQHSHTELVEFVAGRGQVQYPVHTLTRVQWQHVDLGSLAADGTELTATVSEQSLAWITYTTRTLDWRVGLDRDESVQFVLI